MKYRTASAEKGISVGLLVLIISAAILALLISTLSGSANFRSASASSPSMVPFKPASADLSQVRNGGVGCDDTVPNSCDDPVDWVNGNAGVDFLGRAN